MIPLGSVSPRLSKLSEYQMLQIKYTQIPDTSSGGFRAAGIKIKRRMQVAAELDESSRNSRAAVKSCLRGGKLQSDRRRAWYKIYSCMRGAQIAGHLHALQCVKSGHTSGPLFPIISRPDCNWALGAWDICGVLYRWRNESRRGTREGGKGPEG